MRTNLNLPQSRRLCTFRQILARCIDIHSRSPLPKIIKNGDFEVASEFNGKKAIKTRQSSEVVLFCTISENNAVFSGFFTAKSSLSSSHSAKVKTRRTSGLIHKYNPRAQQSISQKYDARPWLERDCSWLRQYTTKRKKWQVFLNFFFGDTKCCAEYRLKRLICQFRENAFEKYKKISKKAEYLSQYF